MSTETEMAKKRKKAFRALGMLKKKKIKHLIVVNEKEIFLYSSRFFWLV